MKNEIKCVPCHHNCDNWGYVCFIDSKFFMKVFISSINHLNSQNWLGYLLRIHLVDLCPNPLPKNQTYLTAPPDLMKDLIESLL
jgi:hypothetical protein